jgi:hypothetical protein
MCGIGSAFASAEVDSYGDARNTWLGDALAEDWESGGGRPPGLPRAFVGQHPCDAAAKTIELCHTGESQYPVFEYRPGFRVKPGMTNSHVLSIPPAAYALVGPVSATHYNVSRQFT